MSEDHQVDAWYMRSVGDHFVVSHNGAFVARLEKTIWGKWKIVGEDTYAKLPDELLHRLMRREAGCADADARRQRTP